MSEGERGKEQERERLQERQTGKRTEVKDAEELMSERGLFPKSYIDLPGFSFSGRLYPNHRKLL